MTNQNVNLFFLLSVDGSFDDEKAHHLLTDIKLSVSSHRISLLKVAYKKAKDDNDGSNSFFIKNVGDSVMQDNLKQHFSVNENTILTAQDALELSKII